MKLKRKFKILFFLVLPVVLVLTIFLLLYLLNPDPPMKVIVTSRKTISVAVNEGARYFAPAELKKAENAREKLMTEWKKQNKTPVYKRDFTKLTELAELSISEAKKAAALSTKRKKQLDKDLQQQMDHANTSIKSFEKKYYHLPIPQSIKNRFIHAKLFYNEAVSAGKREDKIAAFKKVNESGKLLKEVQHDAGKFMEDYFKGFSQWKKWKNETINWSKQNNNYAIIVDKLSHTCTLYKGGIINKVFTIEMGPNWIGSKMQKGDKATPEGKYYITKKLEKKQTIYYKALLINYPNNEDKERFALNKKNGALSQNSHIGNLIEIHGEGGKGIHWTDGCVALLNKEMDILYSFTNVGTPVTIIGSTKSFSELFE